MFTATIVFAAVGWIWFHQSKVNAVGENTDVQGADSSKLNINLEKTVRGPQQSQTDRPVASNSKSLFEQFKERKICLENAGKPEVITQSLVGLREAATRASGEAKTAYNTEIHRKEEQLSILTKCGATSVTTDELSRLLEKAARQGDPAAQLAYAQDPLIDPNHSIENLDRLRAWHDTALTYIQSAADQGNSEAMIALAGAHDPLHCQASGESSCPGMLLGQIVASNVELAYRYYYESKLNGNAPPWVETEMKTLEQYLSPDQIASAHAAAQVALPKH